MAEHGKSGSKPAGSKGRRAKAAKRDAGGATVPAPGKRRRSRRLAQVSPAEAQEALQREYIAEGDLPKREASALLGRTLYGEWLRGYTYSQLSERHKLAESQVEAIVLEYRRAKLQVVPGPASALMMVHGHVARLEHMVGQLSELYDDDAAKKQPQVRLAALKQRAEVMRQWLDVVQEMGWLPRQLGTLNVHMDAVAMADVILEVMDENGVEEAVQRRIVEAIEMRVIRNTDGRLRVDLSDAPVEGHAAELEPAA